jgi:hypothetical protein
LLKSLVCLINKCLTASSTWEELLKALGGLVKPREGLLESIILEALLTRGECADSIVTARLAHIDLFVFFIILEKFNLGGLKTMLDEELLVSGTPQDSRSLCVLLKGLKEWDDLMDCLAFSPELLANAKCVDEQGPVQNILFAPKVAVYFAVLVNQDEQVIKGIINLSLLEKVKLLGCESPPLDGKNEVYWDEPRYLESHEG